MSNIAKRVYGGLLKVADITLKDGDAEEKIDACGGVGAFIQERYDSLDVVDMQLLKAHNFEWSTSEEDWPETVVFYFKGASSQEAEEEPCLEKELEGDLFSYKPLKDSIKEVVAAMGIEAPLKFGTHFWCVSDY